MRNEHDSDMVIVAASWVIIEMILSNDGYGRWQPHTEVNTEVRMQMRWRNRKEECGSSCRQTHVARCNHFILGTFPFFFIFFYHFFFFKFFLPSSWWIIQSSPWFTVARLIGLTGPALTWSWRLPNVGVGRNEWHQSTRFQLTARKRWEMS